MNRHGITLWQFLLDLLGNEKYSHVIRWDNKDRAEFRLIHPEAVAQLWGIRKDKRKMNYDKLSRALRTYYKKNIMVKVKGKEFVYRFVMDKNVDWREASSAALAQSSPSLTNSSTGSSNISLDSTADLSVNCRSFSIDNIIAGEERVSNNKSLGFNAAGTPTRKRNVPLPWVETPKRIPSERSYTNENRQNTYSSVPTETHLLQSFMSLPVVQPEETIPWLNLNNQLLMLQWMNMVNSLSVSGQSNI